MDWIGLDRTGDGPEEEEATTAAAVASPGVWGRHNAMARRLLRQCRPPPPVPPSRLLRLDWMAAGEWVVAHDAARTRWRWGSWAPGIAGVGRRPWGGLEEGDRDEGRQPK